MHRALRRAARVCVATGTLGLPALALAQDVKPASGIRKVGAVPMAPGQGHLEAMKVEMAWLADPTTFGHRLSVRPGVEGLELSGVVPNETVKAHALRVARQHCYLPLVDVIN